MDNENVMSILIIAGVILVLVLAIYFVIKADITTEARRASCEEVGLEYRYYKGHYCMSEEYDAVSGKLIKETKYVMFPAGYRQWSVVMDS